MTRTAWRIVSWNIRHGDDVDRAIHLLRDDEQLRDADAIFLQEMDHDGTLAIAEALGLSHSYATAGPHYRTGRDFGNAVLSPWPLSDEEVIELPHKARIRGQPRVAVKAVATVGDLAVSLSTTHTEIPSLGKKKRDDQVEVLASVAARWPTELAVVGGDFNTVSVKGIRSLTERFAKHGFAHVSSDAVRTLRRVGQDFTLDHVFARGFDAVASGVTRVEVSDHDPVWVELERAAEKS
ncbi:MAG: endonuclease/exonuclease/phosphatase family protein [Acidimicrobiales bacterium]